MSCVPGDPTLVQPRLEQLHDDKGTVVTAVRNLLSPMEVSHLRSLANDKYLASAVQGENGTHTRDQSRTSSTAHIPKGVDSVVKCIEKRIATYCAHPRSHMEPMQVTNYTHRQFYDYHHDYFPNQPSDNRTTTLFAYLESTSLEDGGCGGATAFKELRDAQGNELMVYPKEGDAVMWSNRNLDGTLNNHTLHSGKPVTCAHASKTGLNVWFRDKAYRV